MSEQEPKVNILLVDDHPANLLALEAILGDLGQTLVKAHSGEEALRHLIDQDFAVILLDVLMPGMNGFETAALIRERERTKHMPIIFLTAGGKTETEMFQGYAVGAIDYLLKPIRPAVLRSKVLVLLDLYRKSTEVKRLRIELSDSVKEVGALRLLLKTENEIRLRTEDQLRLLEKDLKNPNSDSKKKSNEPAATAKMNPAP